MNKTEPPKFDIRYKSMDDDPEDNSKTPISDSKTPTDNNNKDKTPTNNNPTERSLSSLRGAHEIQTLEIKRKISKNSSLEGLDNNPNSIFKFGINSFPDSSNDSRLSSFLEETKIKLRHYKRKLSLTIVMVMIFLGILILERIFNKLLLENETNLLISFQESQTIGIDRNGPTNYFYTFIGLIGEFHVCFLIQTHIFVTIYVSFDAFVALKTLFLQFLGCYIISIFSIFYGTPRPFWVDPNIRSYFCDATFVTPGEFQFQSLFLVFYVFKSFKELEDEVVLVDPDADADPRDSVASVSYAMADNVTSKKVLRTLMVLCLMFLGLIFFFRYAQGLSFLHSYVIGMVYFFYLVGLVIFGDKILSDMIKQTTIMKNYARGKIFSWLAFLILAEAFAILIKEGYDVSGINLEWIENYLICQQKNYNYVDNISFNDILGPYPTLQETTIIFGLVGAIFGANTAFQNIATLNWFKGPLKFKIIRAIIANLCIIPSWILIINQQEIVNNHIFGILGAFDAYMINAVHFFILYYCLFGVLPTYIFNKCKCFKVEFKVPQFIPQRIM